MNTRIHREALPFEKEEFLLVVRGDGRLIASSCRVHQWSEPAPMICYVHTASRHRRRGHARRMMVTVLGYLARAGKSAATLWVHKDNAAAAALYQSLGFREMSRSGDQRMMTLFLPSRRYPAE